MYLLTKMRVNKKPFTVYLIDTPDTIKNRIAKKLNTLTKYVKFNPDITQNIIEKNQNITAVNVLLPFLNQTNLNFPIDTYNLINPANAVTVPTDPTDPTDPTIVTSTASNTGTNMSHEPGGIVGSTLNEFTRDQAELFFIITHEEITNNTDHNLQRMILNEMKQNLETVDIIGLWKKKSTILQKYQSELFQQTQKIKDHEQLAKIFEEIPEVSFSKFESKESQFNVLLGKTNLTVSEFFNILKTTPLVPYATMGSFYKIYHTFTPSTSWLELKTENAILLKVNGEIGGDLRDLKNPYKKYTQAAITINNKDIIATMHMNMGHRNISRKEFINRVINTFALTLNELNYDFVNTASTASTASTAESDSRTQIRSAEHSDERSEEWSDEEWSDEEDGSDKENPRERSEGKGNENPIILNTNLTKENPNEKNIVENSVIGYFSYPNQTFYIPVWAELTMNDTVFSSLIAIDEAQRVSKIKQNVYLHVLNTDHDTISLTVKQTIKANMYGLFRIGSNYTIVRIKTKTQELAQKYQKIIARLFTLYNSEENDVLLTYRQYLSDFLKEPNTKKLKKNKLELGDIAPDIFVPNYSRKCPNKPTIISDEDAINLHPEIMDGVNSEDFNNENIRLTTLRKLNNITTPPSLMRFPVFGESQTRTYQCQHDGPKYPGLRNNPLNNRETFPFIPCCFKKDQKITIGSKWKHYFNREPLRKQQPQVQDLFVTNKILKPGFSGVLPKTIKKMFSLLHSDPKHTFVRIGLNRTHNSFLEAILVATGKLKHINPTNIIAMNQHIQNLMNPDLLLATKQELYNYTIPEIQEILKTSMNATYFVHLIEQVYDCNIFIFTSSNKMPDGELIIPPHSQMYIKFQPTRETILIYQHMGSESDNATYPQCELIGRKLVEAPSVNSDNDLLNYPIMSYSAQDDLIKGIFEVFQNINRSFNFDKLILPIAIKILPVISQIIDLYGKCRLITISLNMIHPNSSNSCSIVTDPIPPYAKKISTNLVRGSINTIKTFIKEYDIESNKITLIHQVIINKITREIKAKINNLNITFLCNDPNKISNLKIIQTEEYNEILSPKDTVIEIFCKTKKLAKLLFQYILYYLSHYCQINNITNELTSKQLINFIITKTIIIPDYKYDLNTNTNILMPKFNINSNFMKNRKVIVTSVEMRKRILYQIQMTQQTNLSLILNYYKSNRITDFFENISDFIKFPTEYLFQGETTVHNLIHNINVIQTISKNIQPDHKFPYFFYNTLINNDIYLAQNTTTLELAIRIIKNWIVKKYHPFDPILMKIQLTPYPNLNIEIKFYKYKNTRNIILMDELSKQLFLNKHIDGHGIILGYRIDNVPQYTTLLQIKKE